MFGSSTAALLALGSVWFGLAPPAQAAPDEAFRGFVESVWLEAKAKGVSRATFDRAFQGVEPDLALPDLVLPGRPKSGAHGQAEFVKPPQDYLNRTQLARLAEQGRGFAAQHAGALTQIEQEIGVERSVVMGIWGRETAFGTYKLPHYAIRALATLAYVGRRKEMFRPELVLGLQMMEEGIVTVATMRSSWAGAMGMPQFLPSEYYKYAYDLDRDGRKDIWTSVPDALASAAKQLKDKGWIKGLPWGFEVKLPAKVDCANEGPPDARPLREWSKLGITRADGRAFPEGSLEQPAYLMSPGGTHGPAFLVTDNFKVIRLYNTSDLYSVFVGNLGDRIVGGGDFITPWKGIGQLPTAEIEEMQKRLQGAGLAIDKVDGMIGSNTRRQIGLYQRKAGLAVDCWPSPGTLAALRGGAGAQAATAK